jgi:hypothetical protein
MIFNTSLLKLKKLNLSVYRKFLRIIGRTKDKTSRNLFKLFQIALSFLIVIFIIDLYSIIYTDTNFGSFGDFFGGVLNPILTFLTFMGLLITIVMQQKELRDSRVEFKGQKEALQSQQSEMQVQSFDNKFFQMLNLFNDIKKQVHSQENELFEKIANDLKRIMDEETFKKKFLEINIRYDTTFKYFFLNLYQLINYIDTKAPNEDMKKNYTNIIRALLSKNELILLFYNGIGIKQISGNRYIQIINKYAFFEHITYADLFYERDTIFSFQEINFDFNSDTPSHEHIPKMIDNSFVLNILLNFYNKDAFDKNNDLSKRISDK